MAACVAFISLYIVTIAVAEELLRPMRSCVPTSIIQGPCHRCVCAVDGVYHCLSVPCTGKASIAPPALHEVPANVSIARYRHDDLPGIKEGDPCVPGKTYKVDCNRCRCTDKKQLLCTKMGCVHWSPVLNSRKELRKGSDVAKTKSKLPDVPKGKCVPGRIYKQQCQRCYCTIQRKILCSFNKMAACEKINGKFIPAKVPEDVRPPFKRPELKGIEELPSASKKCTPGKTYKVSCNVCVCTEHYNLLCTRMLCLSFEDINRIEADEKSGKKCIGTKTTKKECIECKCVKRRTECQEVNNCVSENVRAKLSSSSNDTLKMQIDPIKDKCVPNGVYTDDCNRCYCQPDGALRCSLKTCLNYAQSKALDDQFQRLKSEGL